ncbi:undecaprenyldiphospho-muramoylpentapeptide beta-N-acetylglucosaminyltransferase [Corynebacterium tapiri]|uniref:UDP-N-acetylglucosamine--N-acetylmuramyl-(pentapeptide) pyrophosphoryl-undecaprenol N-acetylglucosamine transferase n=1 Tax=Corynebacterium tapiri TaxID=1448266 RepID=A0A5C4U5N8_9CORY|nr:undecaprenyldiphospho-muramoylpentapeptide beta-N-acetylglucosaminyltransferase [Corynebacterium tapiri]TNL99398.1 undecaprenyldiphospho-muramoylpentapeptide beta-N-acetylglucosaminyltransferase [Corynebacterium tapiri]
MATSPLTVLLAGGGTAGHIEPALAVGEALASRHGVQVEALGTTKGLETTIIPARGVQLHLIDPVPIPRKKPWKLLAVPGKLVRSVQQSRRVIKQTGADAVFGTGGYVSASAYLAAKAAGIPFYVLETNALAGMANKLGVRLGGVGLNAVEGSGMAGDVVGIPVRPSLGADKDGTARQRALTQWGLDPQRPTILVTGGSQGAASINAAVAEAAQDLINDGWQILHAYGRKNAEPSALEHYRAVPYIDDMEAALAVADLVVCRSGAMTVAEVTACGVPAIYIPLPHGNGEQGRNSQPVVRAGGAVQIDDADLSGQRLVAQIHSLQSAEGGLAAMKDALASSPAGDAAERIAERIVTDLRR